MSNLNYVHKYLQDCDFDFPSLRSLHHLVLEWLGSRKGAAFSVSCISPILHCLACKQRRSNMEIQNPKPQAAFKWLAFCKHIVKELD